MILTMTTILCVDDNPDLVELMESLLTMIGYEVRTAPGGKECLALLEAEGLHPDLILLDIMMEPMDGWETLLHIRGRPEYRDIPIAMLTGKQPTMKEAREYGPLINDYLMKPYHPDQLGVNIKEILSRAYHVHKVVSLAKDLGCDNSLLSEYQRLAITIGVLNRLKPIINTVEHFEDDFLEQQEKRLAEITEQITKAGVQV
jgi:two-component system, OmpR family, response regulator